MEGFLPEDFGIIPKRLAIIFPFTFTEEYMAETRAYTKQRIEEARMIGREKLAAAKARVEERIAESKIMREERRTEARAGSRALANSTETNRFAGVGRPQENRTKARTRGYVNAETKEVVASR